MKPASIPPRTLRVSLGALIAALVSLGTSPAATQLYSQANAPGANNNQTLVSGTTAAAAANGYFSSGAPVSYEAYSSATFGILGVYAEASAGSNGSGGSTYGNAVARFEDDLTISAAGLEGQDGVLVFLVDVDGALSSEYVTAPLYEDSQSFAYTQLSILRNGSSVYSATRMVYANGATSGTNFLDDPISVSVPFTFGTTFSLRVSLQAQSAASALFGANSVADLAHTLTWEGVTSVTAGGNPVTGYSLSSASGTNYLTPIPEPSSAALVAAAGVLAGLRRSRKAQTIA